MLAWHDVDITVAMRPSLSSTENTSVLDAGGFSSLITAFPENLVPRRFL